MVPLEQLELDGCRVSLRLVLSREGCFRAAVKHDNESVRNGDFYLIVLSGMSVCVWWSLAAAVDVVLYVIYSVVHGRCYLFRGGGFMVYK